MCGSAAGLADLVAVARALRLGALERVELRLEQGGRRGAHAEARGLAERERAADAVAVVEGGQAQPIAEGRALDRVLGRDGRGGREEEEGAEGDEDEREREARALPRLVVPVGWRARPRSSLPVCVYMCI